MAERPRVARTVPVLRRAIAGYRRAGEVDEVVALLERGFVEFPLPDIPGIGFHIRMQPRFTPAAAGKASHLISLTQEPFRQSQTNQAGSTGKKNLFHMDWRNSGKALGCRL